MRCTPEAEYSSQLEAEAGELQIFFMIHKLGVPEELDSSCFAKLLLFYAKIGFTKEWDKQHHFVGVCSGWLGM